MRMDDDNINRDDDVGASLRLLTPASTEQQLDEIDYND